jgi:putative tricarboxylic transport membrane protein
MLMFEGLFEGFQNVLTLNNLFACFIGCFVGTLVGVLPGLGPVPTMGLLLPFTFVLDPTGAIIMLAGIFYGAMYGGSTTSILLNLPGEAASVVTCLDGHEMAKKGRAGAALAASAIGSWIAGTLGLVGLMFFAVALSKVALLFGPIECFAITVLGIFLLGNLSGNKPSRSFLMVFIGILFGCIGTDKISGMSRFTFGSVDLIGGIDLVPMIMGLFGIADVLMFLENREENPSLASVKFRDLYPKKEELKRIIKPSLRGTVVGFLIGLLPGPAAVISSFASYKLEKKVSKNPEAFGTGVIEGVAGPESANNGAAVGSMVPLLGLGIPFAPATAVLLSGFMIHGITPGPLFIRDNPLMFWTIIASMYIGNVILVLLNLPLVGVFASVLRIKARILMPIIVLVCLIGAYGVNNSVFGIFAMVFFGLVGYLFKKVNLDPSPLIVGFILGPMIEIYARQSLVLTDGSFLPFITKPISGSLFLIALLLSVFTIVRSIIKKRNMPCDKKY